MSDLKTSPKATKGLAERLRGDAMLACTLPLFAFVVVGFAAATLTDMLPFFVNHPDSPWYLQDPDQWIKPLQILVGGGALWFFRSQYTKADWNFSWSTTAWAVLAGAVGIGFWLLPTTLYDHLHLADAYEEAPKWFEWLGLEERRDGYNVDVFEGNIFAQAVAITLRFVYACVIVALVEEICWRVFVMRAALNWDHWQTINFGEIHWKTWLVPTVLFISVHQPVDYLGALIYGSLTWLLTVRTKSLSAAVIMHGVANLLMGIYALSFEKYGLW